MRFQGLILGALLPRGKGSRKTLSLALCNDMLIPISNKRWKDCRRGSPQPAYHIVDVAFQVDEGLHED